MAVGDVVTLGLGLGHSVSFIPTLGFSVAQTVAGPYYVDAQQAYVAGARASQGYVAGSQAAGASAARAPAT